MRVSIEPPHRTESAHAGEQPTVSEKALEPDDGTSLHDLNFSRVYFSTLSTVTETRGSMRKPLSECPVPMPPATSLAFSPDQPPQLLTTEVWVRAQRYRYIDHNIGRQLFSGVAGGCHRD